MAYVIVGLVFFVAGVVVCWLFKAKALAAAVAERDALKASAVRIIGKP